MRKFYVVLFVASLALIITAIIWPHPTAPQQARADWDTFNGQLATIPGAFDYVRQPMDNMGGIIAVDPRWVPTQSIKP